MRGKSRGLDYKTAKEHETTDMGSNWRQIIVQREDS